MKLLAATVMFLSWPASAFAQTDPGGDSQTVTIARSGSQPGSTAGRARSSREEAGKDGAFFEGRLQPGQIPVVVGRQG